MKLRYSIYVEEDLMKELKERAKKESRTVGNLINFILESERRSKK